MIAQQENYQKSGFQIAYRHIRYQAFGGGVAPSGIVELKTVPIDKLVLPVRPFFWELEERLLRSKGLTIKLSVNTEWKAQ